MKGRIEINRELCKGCGFCVATCRKEQIKISNTINSKGYFPAEFKGKDVTNPDDIECTGCALCAITCPDVAIEVYREEKKKTESESSEPQE